MAFAIQRNDGKYYAGAIQDMKSGQVGYMWGDRENAREWRPEGLAIAAAREILHAQRDIDFSTPGQIPDDPDFELEVVELDD